MIDRTHWDRLARMKPEEVCRRALASFDGDLGAYRLKLLSDELAIFPEKRAVAWAPGCDRPKAPGFNHWLVSVVYLTSAQEVAPAGEWVQATSLPLGDFFFRGPHVLPAERLAVAFGESPERFRDAALKVGGQARTFGRLAFELPALPRVPMLAQLWEKDDEFPARAALLLDKTAADQIALDAIFSLSIVVVNRLIEAGGTQPPRRA